VADQLTLGAEADFFEREDGYDALCNTYGMSFGNTMQMDIGLKYDALAQGSVDAISDLYHRWQAEHRRRDGPHRRQGLLPLLPVRQRRAQPGAAAAPRAARVLEKLQGTISEQDMARMNYEVEEEGKDPKTVAEEFLSSKGLI
jgi:osmoprotectant transport system permease protein